MPPPPQLQMKQKEGKGQTAPAPGRAAEGRPQCCPAKLGRGAGDAHRALLLPEDDGLEAITYVKPPLEILLVTVPQPSALGPVLSWAYPSPPLALPPASARARLCTHCIGTAVSPKYPEATQRIRRLPLRFVPAALGVPPPQGCLKPPPKAWADLHSLT